MKIVHTISLIKVIRKIKGNAKDATQKLGVFVAQHEAILPVHFYAGALFHGNTKMIKIISYVSVISN